METLDCIFSRRSIRKYKQIPIEKEKIQLIIKAGMYAPSAGNQQPWHFIVIDDRNLLDYISEKHPHAKMLKEAQIAILVCADLNLEIKYKNNWVLDCSAAVENMLLCATDLGIGSVWLGVYPNPDRIEMIRKLFDLPENIIPHTLISLGYPNEEKSTEDRFKPERIHYNKW